MVLSMRSNTSPRKYNLGDTIPGHGRVVDISVTAYCVVVDDAPRDWRYRWVPFYGPRGVDEPARVDGLVTFVDGSRYGAAEVADRIALARKTDAELQATVDAFVNDQ